MSSIGDLFFSLRGDGSRLARDAETEGKKAGDKGGGSFRSAFQGQMGTMLGAGAGAAFGGFARSVVEGEDAVASLQAQLGLTRDEAVELGDVAQDVWRDGWGGSISEVTDQIAIVRQNLGDLEGEALASATSAANIVAGVSKGRAGIEDITRTAGVMLANFDGLSETDAFDLMTVGFQRGGDYSGELLDTMREYAPQFAAMGVGADEMLSILLAGAEAGAWNLDKVGDAIKELNLRAQDPAARQAFEDIGLNADEMSAAIAEGGPAAQTAMAAILGALASVDDEQLRMTAGVALMGAPYEDLSATVVASMATNTGALQDWQGATESAGEAISSGPTAAVQGLFRGLVGLVNDGLGPFKGAVIEIAPLLAVFGSSLPLVTSLLGGLGGMLFKSVIPALFGVGKAIMGLIVAGGPIGLIVLAIGALFLAWQTNFLGIQDIVNEIFGWIEDVALPWITGIFDAIADGIGTAVGVITGVIEGILGVVSTVASAIGGLFDFITGGTSSANAQLDAVRAKQMAWRPSQGVIDSGQRWEQERRAQSYATGAWEIPTNQPAFLHAGEMVVPAGPAETLRQVLSGVPRGVAAGGGNTYVLVTGGVDRTFNSRTDFMNALDDLARHGEGGLDG